jgi:putative hydrolase of the HAD superfamily
VTTSAFSAQKLGSAAPRVPAGMGAHTIGAVSFDVLGTLLALEPPAPRLRVALREEFGVEVGEAEAERAIAAEIVYYRAHMHEAVDGASLAALRRRCAGVLCEALPPTELQLDLERLTGVLLASIRFSAYPDAEPALRALRERGLRLLAVSNWDVSLHEQLAAGGLAGLLDAAVSSAEAGVAKPDPAIFAQALALVGVAPGVSVHVGDDVAADVGGALAAGLAPVLIDRAGTATAPPGVPVIASLAELPALCA